MTAAADGKLVRFAKREAVRAGGDAGRWKILIVDDESEVHRITELVLRDKVFFGRKLEFLDAFSALECMDLLRLHHDTAVILLDVVMETDDAGLRLAKWIREDLRNDAVRIILRTGQRGRAPEERVIVEYEINDYKEKTELTADKLFSTVVNAIRGYRDIKRIQGSKNGMEMILNAAPSLFKLQSLKLFASGVLTQMISLLSATQDAAFIDISGFAARIGKQGFIIVAGAGKYSALIDSTTENAISPSARAAIARVIAEREQLYEGGIFANCMEGPSGELGVIYLEGCPRLEEIDLRLVSLYGVNVTAAFSNNRLYEELEVRLREKDALLHEIHHRVENNLQIIASLIDLAENDSLLSPPEMLDETKRRIFMMSIVYNHVLDSERGDEVDFASCIDEIVSTAERSPAVGRTNFRIGISVEEFVLPLAKAVPCALLINEMVSIGSRLAGKAAPGSGAPALSLALDGRGEDGYAVSIHRDGCSLHPDSGDAGTILLKVLVDQLDGRLAFEECGGSGRISVAF